MLVEGLGVFDELELNSCTLTHTRHESVGRSSASLKVIYLT